MGRSPAASLSGVQGGADVTALLAANQTVVNILFLVLLIGLTGVGGLIGLYVFWRARG